MFDQGHSSVQRTVSESGGILPPQRGRSQRALTPAEREEISRGIVGGRSMRSIAHALGRAPSTVSGVGTAARTVTGPIQESHQTIDRTLFIQARGTL